MLLIARVPVPELPTATKIKYSMDPSVISDLSVSLVESTRMLMVLGVTLKIGPVVSLNQSLRKVIISPLDLPWLAKVITTTLVEAVYAQGRLPGLKCPQVTEVQLISVAGEVLVVQEVPLDEVIMRLPTPALVTATYKPLPAQTDCHPRVLSVLIG
jgi:hypothetical protein